MLTILAIDTSTEACSAALYVDGKISFRYEVAPQKHAALLLNYCDELLAEANITPADLSAVAFGRGPGSFTGVRIATAAAQGIAIAHNMAVIPVSSLQILAQVGYKKFGHEKIYAGIDARMGEIYFGEYQLNKNNNLMELVGQEVVNKLENLKLEPETKQRESYGRIGSAFQKDNTLFPHAEILLEIALEDYKNKKMVEAQVAMPVYLRDNVVL